MTQPADRTIAHDLPNLSATAVVPADDLSRPTGGWRLLFRGPVNLACVGVIALYLLVAFVSLLPGPRDVPGLRRLPLIGDLYGLNDLVAFKYNFDADHNAVAPSTHWTDEAGHRHTSIAGLFGTDFQGHSVFWRTLYGARTALLITVLSSALQLTIGTTLGVVAGYFGGWVDDCITWLYSVVGTVPWLLLVIAVSYVLTQNAALADVRTTAPGYWETLRDDLLPTDILIVVLALGFTDWVSLCRLIRGEVIKLRDSDMVAAARAVGLTEGRILFRHIVPNVSHLIIITFTLAAIGYLQVEVVLAFLGIGVTSKPSWGRMIDDAKLALLQGNWWEVTAATAAIFVICMALTLLGDALRDALDPKTRGRS